MELISSVASFGGQQNVYRHTSKVLGCDMQFGLYLPPAPAPRSPALLWLSGLTCTEENFISKAGAQRVAAELGTIIIAPDTSPRGESVPDDADGAYDFGLGAGFYVNATEAPFAQHYQMQSYITDELYQLVLDNFPVDPAKIGISGHSMGGHGALTLALKFPGQFASVSAFAPICSPMECPWGHKALGGYLGDDKATWRQYDACTLIADGHRAKSILVDQGTADNFLEEQLKPQLLERACTDAGIKLTLRRQEGYDHSYYFIASFIEDHLRWHAGQLDA